jgi:UDP-N-acetylglucosamine 2-epimerase (non-hydrolysing)
MILICFGTRPEWLKIKPLLSKVNHKLLFTGQHTDLVNEIDFDYIIKQQDKGNRLDSIITNCLDGFPNDPTIESVLVQGDTASAFACALAAFNRGIKLIHLEAGLRTYDLSHPYPEEAYRQMISRIATLHLCPTELSKDRLDYELCAGDSYVVGNTVLDNLLPYKNNITYGKKVLVTMHRRENHDTLKSWFIEIEKLAEKNKDIEFILPLHPNPNVEKYRDIFNNVTVVDPLSHIDIINLLTTCLLTITDSGGIQEEATFLNKKSIVCRKTTERPEGIDTGHLFLCDSPQNLEYLFDKLKENPIISTKCPYGDGLSSHKIANILNNRL